ncbi:serine protease gd-like [Chironomus tepperi]|uniref:serine protease gd-like n=1 Tax=Chironomus tepperi TaxID=113505 RepID=UPI00391F2C4E
MPSYIENKLENANNGQSNLCGVRRDSSSAVSFVIGARRNDFPWLTAFYYKENGFICGGTLVSTKIIVTAAHCVKDKQNIDVKSPEDSIFYLGKYKLNDLNEKDYVTAGVKQFIIHPSWDSFEERYIGDLAIVVIFKTIKFTNNIIPLCISSQRSSHEDIVDKSGLVAGWGLIENGTISEVPKFVSLPVVDDGKCLRSDEVFTKITSTTTFCVGDGSGRSPCNGDSGGAFAVKNDAENKYYFRGIISSGIRGSTYSCDNTKYAIFTDVAQYTDWIKSYITMYG